MNVQNGHPSVSDWRIFGTAFAVVFLAQLPGKSALTALVFSSRYRTLPVLFGAGLALAAHSVIAVAAGGLLSLLPARPIHVAAGLLFMVSAIFVWRGRPQEGERSVVLRAERAVNFMRAFGLTFTAIFVAEWGDLTQLATAALAARYGKPVPVLVAAVLGLWIATGIAILIGRVLGDRLRPAFVQTLAAAAFGALGVALIIGAVQEGGCFLESSPPRGCETAP